MRFVLDENIKYILDEKYLLNERYILAEASEKLVTVLKNWLKKLTTELEPIVEKITKIKATNNVSKNAASLEADQKAINDAAKDVNISRNNPDGQDEELKKDLTTWYQAAKNLVNKRPNYRNNVNNTDVARADNKDVQKLNANLNELNSYLTGNFDKAKALNIFDIFNSSVETAFQNAASIQQKNSTDKVTHLHELCDRAVESIDNFKKFIDLDYSQATDEELKACITSLNELSEFETKADNNILSLADQINFNDFEKNYQTYAARINSLITELNKFASLEAIRTAVAKQAAKQAEEETKEKARSDRQNAAAKDWKTLYDKCNTSEEFKAFWEDYFKTEWGAKATAVSEFGTAFTNDLKKIGWDSITNPFIKFLKTDIIYNAIGKEFDQAAYISIHNAYVRNYIRQSDLIAGNNSIYKKSNLIFNLHLYAESLDNFTRYLKYQSQLAANGAAGSLKPPASQIWVKDREQVLNNLMLADGDIDSFDKEISAGGKLRSLTEIAQALQQVADISADEKQTATNKNVVQVLDRVKDERTAKALLAYLIDILRGINQNAVDDADTKIGKGIIYDAHDKTPRTTISQADNFDNNYLDRHNLEYNKKQWVDIILGLAAKAGLYTPRNETK